MSRKDVLRFSKALRVFNFFFLFGGGGKCVTPRLNLDGNINPACSDWILNSPIKCLCLDSILQLNESCIVVFKTLYCPMEENHIKYKRPLKLRQLQKINQLINSRNIKVLAYTLSEGEGSVHGKAKRGSLLCPGISTNDARICFGVYNGVRYKL
jgi:hypothetical protein